MHAFSQLSVRRSRLGFFPVSLAMHGIALLLLLEYSHHAPIRVFNLPGTPAGAHVELTYLPGRAPAPALPPKVLPRTKLKPAEVAVTQLLSAPAALPELPALPMAIHPPPRPHLTFTPQAPSSSLSAPPSDTVDSTAGSDSWGSGSIQIAFTTYSPSPAPDLSVLPPGVQGDVIVDVTIDPSGKVSDLAILQTLGYGIESNVVRTVRTWVFRPATKDGVPIASVQELHFHFGPV